MKIIVTLLLGIILMFGCESDFEKTMRKIRASDVITLYADELGGRVMSTMSWEDNPVKRIPKGGAVRVYNLLINNEYYMMQDETGFVSKYSFKSTKPARSMWVRSQTVNVRSGHGKDYGVVRKAKQGDMLEIDFDSKGTWLKINGRREYVYADLLSDSRVARFTPREHSKPRDATTTGRVYVIQYGEAYSNLPTWVRNQFYWNGNPMGMGDIYSYRKDDSYYLFKRAGSEGIEIKSKGGRILDNLRVTE